ncbi:MAG: right-handed parallel beta-helix repeat-containing protein [Polyangiaceae bacterium]|nr:right-handed parallel beta-helix repeat-containing protein [Polyangiaceae bacterium]
MNRLIAPAVTASLLFTGALASAATLTVGPGQTYPKPCAAFAAAQDGDTIEIAAAGNYDGDVCSIQRNRLTIRGVGGLAKIDAAGKNAGGKAIWVITGNDTTVENIEFSGATVPDENGAGIRQEGANLTVRGCYFHDNENGILAGNSPNSTILIERSEFNHNGHGDGQTHNLYINHVAKFIFRYNWSHRASIGHLVKSRAAETHILYNRLTGESDGTQSYEIDVPNGGRTYVIGNLVQQGPQTDNSSMLAYREEGPHADNPSDALFVINNTFVNERGSGGTFVRIGGSTTTPAVLRNNVFQGPGTITDQASAQLDHNYSGATTCLVDAASFDYRLVAGTPCVDGGADPGSDGAMSLMPAFEYLHPMNAASRVNAGAVDIGAYELGGPGGSGGAGGAGGSGGGSAGAGGQGGAAGGAGGSGAGAPGSGGSGGQPGGAGTGTGGGAGTGAGAGSAAGGAPASGASDDGGCGCRVTNDAGSGSKWAFFALAAGLALLRRRR